MADKSPEAIAIIAKLKKAKGGTADEETSEGEPAGSTDKVDEEAKLTASEDAMSAIKDRNPEALKEALSAFMEACGY